MKNTSKDFSNLMLRAMVAPEEIDIRDYQVICNLTHAASGKFKIVRIDENLVPVVLYSNQLRETCANGVLHLKYEGYLRHIHGFTVMTSGFISRKVNQNTNIIKNEDIILYFLIDENGSCTLQRCQNHACNT